MSSQLNTVLEIQLGSKKIQFDFEINTECSNWCIINPSNRGIMMGGWFSKHDFGFNHTRPELHFFEEDVKNFVKKELKKLF